MDPNAERAPSGETMRVDATGSSDVMGGTGTLLVCGDGAAFGKGTRSTRAGDGVGDGGTVGDGEVDAGGDVAATGVVGTGVVG
jgi:hypothetical protein